jgi:hypothetical protein
VFSDWGKGVEQLQINPLSVGKGYPTQASSFVEQPSFLFISMVGKFFPMPVLPK